eukprot:m.56949 g.56949  ORF g.56949 m.56949 type:complete len:51 (-) comp12683_c1_seq1:59-211(-)
MFCSPPTTPTTETLFFRNGETVALCAGTELLLWPFVFGCVDKTRTALCCC